MTLNSSWKWPGTGSLTKAATSLRASQSTAARHVMELEESLGARLFERHQTGYVLTDEGQEIMHEAEEAEDGMLAVTITCGWSCMPI